MGIFWKRNEYQSSEIRLKRLLAIMEKNKNNPLGKEYQDAARAYYRLRDSLKNNPKR